MEVKNLSRIFSCKDEELPVICGLVSLSFRRDRADFEAHSALFNDEFINGYDQLTNEVNELVAPQAESLLKQAITKRMYETMQGLIKPLDYLTDYVNKSDKEFPLTPANFGISGLKLKIRSVDPEAVIDRLNVVIQNIENHKAALMAKGMKEDLLKTFKDAKNEVYNLRLQQKQIISNRQSVVQANIDKLNKVYAQLKNILGTGKALYKGTDPVKLKDYTFSELKRKVKLTTKAKNEKNTVA